MTKKVDVLIVGAGVSGLSAAGMLSQDGLNVLVLEGRERVGGRILTVMNEYCHPIELGAEFIHGKQKELFRILDESRLRIVDVSNHHRLIVNGELISPEEYHSKLEEIFQYMYELARTDEMTFREFESRLCATRPHLKEIMPMVHSYVEDFNAADANLVSIQWLKSAAEAEERNDSRAMFRLVGGYSTLVEALKKKIPDESILLNHTVKKIIWSGSGVELEALHNDELEKFTAAAAIVTLPLSVLQSGPAHATHVEFEPPLPDAKTCVGALVMGGALRLIFQFRTRFWEEKTLNGKDNLINLGFIHEPELDFQTWWSQLPVRTPILVGWFAGGGAHKLIGRTLEELKESALNSLATILRTERRELDEQFEKLYFHDWNSDPYSLGAYSYAVCGSADAAQRLARPLAGKLFFAGEATNTEGEAGTVHGAIQTGLRAASEVAAIYKKD